MTLYDLREELARRRRALILSILETENFTSKQIADLAVLQGAISAVRMTDC
jgi:hypothetical protein